MGDLGGPSNGEKGRSAQEQRRGEKNLVKSWNATVKGKRNKAQLGRREMPKIFREQGRIHHLLKREKKWVPGGKKKIRSKGVLSRKKIHKMQGVEAGATKGMNFKKRLIINQKRDQKQHRRGRRKKEGRTHEEGVSKLKFTPAYPRFRGGGFGPEKKSRVNHTGVSWHARNLIRRV